MKKRNLLSGFALAVLMTLGIGVAHAQTYPSCTDFNNNNPSAPTGNVVVNEPGNCSLNSATITTGSFTVIAGGTITASSVEARDSVTLTGTNVTATDVTSDLDSIKVEATTGNIVLTSATGHGSSIQMLANGSITLNGAVTGSNLTQIYSAGTTLRLQDVTNSNGDVRIFANQNGVSSPSPFTIGSDLTNGVLSVHTSGGAAIYISNGSSGGEIDYNGDDLLQAAGSGDIIIDAHQTSNLILTGTLSNNGTTGSGGFIHLFASSIIANGITLNANAPGQTVGQIGLFTSLITLNDDLTLNINGNGPLAGALDLSILPLATRTVTATTNPFTPIVYGAYTPTQAPVSIIGTGNLNIFADGNDNGVEIVGYPLSTAAGTTVTITQHGSGNHAWLLSSDTAGNFATLTLSGAVEVHENNNAPGQTQSIIDVGGTSIDADNVLLDAAGLSSADGGTINILATTGDVNIGNSSSSSTIKADGGPSGGNAGNITLNCVGADVKVNGAATVTADGIAASASGGQITVYTKSFTNPAHATGVVSANAVSSGIGGQIEINSTEAINLGNAVGGISISANGESGIITIVGDTFVQAPSRSISATTLTSGQTAGTIDIHALGSGSGSVMLITQIDASATGSSGSGGSISITSEASSGTANLQIAGSVKADGGASSGDPGFISILATQAFTGNGVQFDSTAALSAKSASPGPGGNTGIVIASYGDLKVTSIGATFDATNNQLLFTAFNDVDLSLLRGSGSTLKVLSPLSVQGNNVAVQVDSVTANEMLFVDQITSFAQLSFNLQGTLGLAQFNSSVITADQLVLLSGGNIGSATSSLQTAVNSLSAVSTNGNVYVSNSNGGAALNLTPSTAFGVANIASSANGLLQIVTDGDISIGTFALDAIVSAAGDVVIQSTNANSTIDVVSDIKTTNGKIKLSIGGAAGNSCAATNPACRPSGVNSSGVLSQIFFNTPSGIVIGFPIGMASVETHNSSQVWLDSGSSGTIILEPATNIIAN